MLLIHFELFVQFFKIGAIFQKIIILLLFKYALFTQNFTKTAYIFKTLDVTLIQELNVRNNFYMKKNCRSSKMLFWEGVK